MTETVKHWHIGVIPPNEDKTRKFVENWKSAVEPSRRIVPNSYFHLISYQRLLEVHRKNAAYDIVLAARMRDRAHSKAHNIYNTVLELRRDKGRRTIFVLSFNELLAAMKGLSPEVEKSYIRKIEEHNQNPNMKNLGGIVRTTSTDPMFLVTVLGDIIEGADKYKALENILDIESQNHFLNHPPGQTMLGLSQ